MDQRLLVVDDQKNIAFAIRAYFSALGYQVDSAATAAEAKEKLDRVRYALLIVDLRLTGSSCCEGLAVASAARDRHPALPIVVLSAFGTPEAEEEARALGVAHFLTKPARLRDLESITAALLGRRNDSDVRGLERTSEIWTNSAKAAGFDP